MNARPTSPFLYRISGLFVASDVELPARSPITDDVTPDVTIGVAAIPARLDHPTHGGANWAADARHFLLDLADIGRFLATDGRRITLEPAPGMPVDDILIFVTGTMIAAILYQRGGFLLHASAVVHQGRAYLFCGPSGAGKSTLASAMARAGCAVLADDMCAIDWRDGVAMVQTDGRALRLYPDSIEHMALADAMGPRVRRQIDKYHVTPPASAGLPDGGVPLGGIYMLADANSVVPAGITRLPAISAAQALLRQSYRRRIALAYSQDGQLARHTAAILSGTTVHALHRPRDLTRIDETTGALFEHWASDRAVGAGDA